MRELEYCYQSKKKNGHTKTILMTSFFSQLRFFFFFLEKAQSQLRKNASSQ